MQVEYINTLGPVLVKVVLVVLFPYQRMIKAEKIFSSWNQPTKHTHPIIRQRINKQIKMSNSNDINKKKKD